MLFRFFKAPIASFKYYLCLAILPVLSNARGCMVDCVRLCPHGAACVLVRLRVRLRVGKRTGALGLGSMVWVFVFATLHLLDILATLERSRKVAALREVMILVTQAAGHCFRASSPYLPHSLTDT